MQAYADTTVIARAIFGDSEEREAIATAKGNRELVATDYVREQYRASFVNDAVLLHTLVRESATVGEAMRRLGRYPRVRQRDRAREVFSLLLDDPRYRSDRRLTLDMLEVFIEVELDARFREAADGGIVEITGCTLGGPDPERVGSLYHFKPRCRKSDPPRCNVGDFLATKKRELRDIGQGPDAIDEAQTGLRDACRTATEAPHEIRGNLCRRTMSDTIIALSPPEGVPLCTTDVDDVEAVCAQIGRPLIDCRRSAFRDSTKGGTAT